MFKSLLLIFSLISLMSLIKGDQSVLKLIKFDESYSVTEGEDLKLFCKLAADTEGEHVFQWYSKPDSERPVDFFMSALGSSDSATASDETDERTQNKSNSSKIDEDFDLSDWTPLTNSERLAPNELEPHFRIINPDTGNQSMLKIEDAVYEDRAYYLCEVTNDRGQRSLTSTLVRVKSRFALLYPIIALVIEAVVLALTIYLCERFKGEEMAFDDDDDDEDEQNGRVPSQDQNLRQRRH